jgi:hypothetical protein
MSGIDSAQGSGGSPELHRRDLLLAAGTTIALGLDAAVSSPKADIGTPLARIDAHTHFAPLKFLEFVEKEEGHPFPLSPMYKSKPALIDIQARLDFLDQNGIDINVLVPVPWIEAFHKVYADPALAAQAARLMNDELATIVASHPTRFRGVAILPVVDPDAMVAELHRAVNSSGPMWRWVRPPSAWITRTMSISTRR